MAESPLRQYAREAMASAEISHDRKEQAVFYDLACTWALAAAIEEGLEGGLPLSGAPTRSAGTAVPAP